MSCQKRAGTLSLEGMGMEAEPDSQCLIFLEKLLLKAPNAVDSDSVARQCLNCSFLLAPIPKCSYCMSWGCKSMLLTCSFSFQNPGWRYPRPSGLPHVMLWLWLPFSSILSKYPSHCCPAFAPCSAAALYWALQAGWQAGWTNPWFSYFCSIFTAPQYFFPLHVCGWKTSEAFFLIKKSS